MIDYNVTLLNFNDLQHSFFCLDKDDPTKGFEYDARSLFGQSFPRRHRLKIAETGRVLTSNDLELRLILGSHLARYLRHECESQKGYTATVGIATNKILSKLVGNVNKPKNQTTLMPPYEPDGSTDSVVTQFMDSHEIGKIPGIGFKLARKIRAKIHEQEPDLSIPKASDSLAFTFEAPKEPVTVRDVRLFHGMGPEMLEYVLSGPGSQKGIGGKMWELLNGIDNGVVSQAKVIPSQISQEDSYMTHLRTFDDIRKQLLLLAERLINRMHIDLTEDEQDADEQGQTNVRRRWLAYPRTLRLSTRPRPAPGPDGPRTRSFHRISRSGPLPNFALSLSENVTILAEKLVDETLMPMFRKLHPEKSGWYLSLLNVAVTNMAETAADNTTSDGRDIGRMFKRQDDLLKDFRISDSTELDDVRRPETKMRQSAQLSSDTSIDYDDGYDQEDEPWDSEENEQEVLHECGYCTAQLPAFAWAAHQRYHELTSGNS